MNCTDKCENKAQCPFCDLKFCFDEKTNESKFSQHMNISHRGKAYKGLYQANHIVKKVENETKHENRTRKPKPNVRTKLD